MAPLHVKIELCPKLTISTAFGGFQAPYQNSVKEPDSCPMILADDFPCLVIETGWSESYPKLKRDRCIPLPNRYRHSRPWAQPSPTTWMFPDDMDPMGLQMAAYRASRPSAWKGVRSMDGGAPRGLLCWSSSPRGRTT